VTRSCRHRRRRAGRGGLLPDPISAHRGAWRAGPNRRPPACKFSCGLAARVLRWSEQRKQERAVSSGSWPKWPGAARRTGISATARGRGRVNAVAFCVALYGTVRQGANPRRWRLSRIRWGSGRTSRPAFGPGTSAASGLHRSGCTSLPGVDPWAATVASASRGQAGVGPVDDLRCLVRHVRAPSRSGVEEVPASKLLVVQMGDTYIDVMIDLLARDVVHRYTDE
jgi:hypothetical protein